MSDDDLDAAIVEEITEQLAGGRKIEAIKTYRQATGRGLKEAKDFIDQLIPRLVEQDPERFAKASGAGCQTAAVLLIGLGGAVAGWLFI